MGTQLLSAFIGITFGCIGVALANLTNKQDGSFAGLLRMLIWITICCFFWPVVLMVYGVRYVIHVLPVED